MRMEINMGYLLPTEIKTGNIEKYHIFKVALSLLDELGYEKMTIRKICEEANISIGKFYHYFSSKQELLNFFYQQVDQAFKEDARDSLKGHDGKTQIIMFYTWHASYLERMGLEFVKNFFDNRNPVMNPHIYNNPIIVITDDIIMRAVQNGYKIKGDGTIRDLSCELCTIVKGIIFDWCVMHGEFSLENYMKSLVTKCINGIM